MTDPADNAPAPDSREGLLIRCSQLAAWVISATAALVLLGWMFDAQLLTSVGFSTMPPNVALGFLLVGSAATQLYRSGSATSRRLIQLYALAVLLLSVLSLTEYALAWNVGTGLWSRNDPSAFAGSRFAPPMSCVTALNFILLGSGLLLLASRRPALRRVGDTAACLAALFGLLALASYLYGAPEFNPAGPIDSMAALPAAMFVILAIALLMAPPIRGLAALLAGDDDGAILARSLLPVAIIATLVAGYVRLLGEQRGLFGARFGFALFATLPVFIVAVMIYRTAGSLRARDARRRDAEHALHDSELKLRLLMHNARDYATFMLDTTGRIVSWNDGARRLKGYAAGEILGQHFSSFYTPEDLAAGKPERQLLRAQDEGACEDEGWRLRKDGSRFWASVVIVSLKDEQGQLRGFGKITHDRTERKAIEEARRAELKQRNERFAIASEAAGLGFWDFDIRSNAFRWDERMFALHGRSGSAAEQPYSVWSQSLHPSDRKRIEQELNEAINGKRDFHTEFRVVHPSGDIRHLKASARVKRHSDGHPVQLIGVSVDTTERKRAEDALRESEQRYRFLAEAMPQIIWTARPDGNLDYYNQQWYRYTGLSFEQSKDWGWRRAVHPDDLRNCVERWSKAITGGDYEIECRVRRAADGAYRWHLGRAFPLRDPHGAIIQWVGTCTDIEDQKRAEERLREAYATLEQRVLERTGELSATKAEAERANEAKSEFLANISHEIRTPLNAVIGLGYLLEQTTLTDDQHQYLRKIQFAGRSLLSVVNNVLDLSKIEASEVTLEDQSFDLPELLLDVSQMLDAQAKAKGIELIVQHAAELPRQLIGDAARLRQILINLVNNAIKFTDAGHVELNAYCAEQGSDCVRLHCEVADTGIGIEPAAIKRIFAPFAQADASTTRRFGGTGLGLSIAHHLVKLMNGEIDVNSTVAVGSTFWFEIPLRVARSDDGTIGARGLRIGIVDSGVDALSGMVNALGWSPQIFTTGEQLLGFLSGAQPTSWPHVLIAQLHLSDMDAHQLIESLENECTRSEAPPIIIVTDSAQSYLLHQRFMRPTDALLVLPLTSSALFNAVNAVVSKRPDGRESMLRSTSNVLNARWLIGVRVLVVDDSAVNREVAQGILHSQGAIVSSCSDGRTALEHVRAHHQQLDAVLMDVQMPIMDGNEATRLIRGELNLRTLPIVALTAGALVSERQRALKAGMNDIVTKPFDPQVLIKKVRYLVEQTRNEAIPIDILHSKRGLQPAEEPFIPSIDAGVVQQMFGEDLPLFKSALARMLGDYGEFAAPITASLDDQGARTRLKARVHELRGSAGLIGATGVMCLAGAAETALEQGRSADVVAPMLVRLTSAFADMRDEAQSWLARQAEQEAPSDGKAEARPAIGAADVDDLYALLDSRNLAALDKFSLLSPALSALIGAARFERLRDAIDNLDFLLGAQLLRESRRPLPA